MKVSTLKVDTPPKSAIVSKITNAIPAIIVGHNEGIITFLIAVILVSPSDFAALNTFMPTEPR